MPRGAREGAVGRGNDEGVPRRTTRLFLFLFRGRVRRILLRRLPVLLPSSIDDVVRRFCEDGWRRRSRGRGPSRVDRLLFYSYRHGRMRDSAFCSLKGFKIEIVTSNLKEGDTKPTVRARSGRGSGTWGRFSSPSFRFRRFRNRLWRLVERDRVPKFEIGGCHTSVTPSKPETGPPRPPRSQQRRVESSRVLRAKFRSAGPPPSKSLGRFLATCASPCGGQP